MKKLLNGILIVVLVTAAAYMVQGFGPVKHLNLSSLIIAILIGALVKNTIGVEETLQPGINFCAKKVLRLAVIMLGFKLSLEQITQIGFKAVILITIVSTLTLIFTKQAGKWLKVPDKLCVLLGTGTSICGAAAIAATNPIIKANEEDVAYSIGAITLFGTVFMFFYPLVFKIAGIDTGFYSLWSGSSIHEVAQVVAAGFAVSPDVGTMATLVKLTRVLFIIPVTVYLTFKELKRSGEGKFDLKKISVPWFVIMFLAVITVNSTVKIPAGVLQNLVNLDGYLMTVAMAALGLGLSFANMRQVGLKPLYLGLAASLFISVLSAAAIKLIGVM